MNLKDNTVLITGGGSGIGRGLAEAFHRLGNKVVIAGRRRDVLEETAAANPGIDVMELDTRKVESIRAAVAAIAERCPDLNLVINNAGVQRVLDFAGDVMPADEDLTEEVDTNINGVVRMTAAFLPHLKTMANAGIVNVSSGLAFVPIARFPVYCATKAFVHSFSMSLRFQLRNTSVRVIELAPPWVKTDLDSKHGGPTEHEGMQPMPLADFIAAAMEELATEADEKPVAGAKFLQKAGADMFDRINR